jgi:hypothetical protein
LLTEARWADLLDIRAHRPEAVATALAARARRPLLTDGRLFLVAADHPARGMLGVGEDPLAMADRRSLLERVLVALAHPGVDGILGSPDVIDELALLGALDSKVVVGTMNRGGLQGAVWELDDPLTAYDVDALAKAGLDGGKLLLRIHDGDGGTRPTLELCARQVSALAGRGLMAMLEPLPYHDDPDTGRATYLDDETKLIRAVAIASALGNTSAHTWLKVPATANVQRVLAATTLPCLVLGGAPEPDAAATYAQWEAAMAVPVVRGLVVGRALLYPRDGDVAEAVDRAAAIVRPGAT